jgi:hypothetical protein
MVSEEEKSLNEALTPVGNLVKMAAQGICFPFHSQYLWRQDFETFFLIIKDAEK